MTTQDIHLVFKKKVVCVLTFQSFISAILTFLCFSNDDFAGFFRSNFWTFYLGLSFYLISVLSVLILEGLRSPPMNYLLLSIVVVSSNVFDSGAASLSPKYTFLVIFYLFAGCSGLTLYLLLATKHFDNKWGIFSVFIGTLLTFVINLIIDSSVWGVVLIIFVIGSTFGCYVILVINDLTDRYSIDPKNFYYGSLLLYLDILFWPYVISFIKKKLAK